jgi:hypothetical protein
LSSKTFRIYNATSGSLSATAPIGGLTASVSFPATSATAWQPRTMLQLAPAASGSGPAQRILGWGYSFLTPPANAPVMELIDSGTVFASGLTAHVAAGIQKMNNPLAEPSTLQLGTALTGYFAAGGSAPTEGTFSAGATRALDAHAENGLYFYWRFELEREPEVAPGNCLRLRGTSVTATAVPVLCWVDLTE